MAHRMGDQHALTLADEIYHQNLLDTQPVLGAYFSC